MEKRDLSTIALLHHSFAVTAVVGPLAATSEQVGDIEVMLRDRGFFERYPSFGFRSECRVRKTGAGFVEVPDQKDFYIVGAALSSMALRVQRELATVIKRVTGESAVFSRIPRMMLVSST